MREEGLQYIEPDDHPRTKLTSFNEAVRGAQKGASHSATESHTQATERLLVCSHLQRTISAQNKNYD